jgi:hypothetical protein
VQAASFSRYSLTRGFKLGVVSPRFFETMGIPIQQGRDFAPSDDEGSPRVVILSASLTRKLFPARDAIGQMLSAEQALAMHLPPDSARPHERVQVIGVAGDIRQRKRQQGWDEIVFIPLTQSPNQMLGQVKLLVRADRTPSTLIAPLREAVRRAAPDVPLIGPQTQAQELDAFMGEERSLASLVSGFGALALALATLGLYGTAAYAVRRRTRELGIRLALGAQRSAVVWMVVRETLPLLALGVGGGLVLAILAGRLLAATLFGVGAVDPVSMALTVMLMTLLTLVATVVPARRAAGIDPLRALREE